jgi:hypothetical protein
MTATTTDTRTPGTREAAELLGELHADLSQCLARWLRRQGTKWLPLAALGMRIDPEDAEARAALERVPEGGKPLRGKARVRRGHELLLAELTDQLQRDGVCEVRKRGGGVEVRLLEAQASEGDAGAEADASPAANAPQEPVAAHTEGENCGAHTAPGKHTLEFDWKYDGPGLGKGGTGTLKVDGKALDSHPMARSLPVGIGWCDTFDVGIDTGTPVDDKDYQVPFRFTGKIGKLTIKLGPEELTPAEREMIYGKYPERQLAPAVPPRTTGTRAINAVRRAGCGGRGGPQGPPRHVSAERGGVVSPLLSGRPHHLGAPPCLPTNSAAVASQAATRLGGRTRSFRRCGRRPRCPAADGAVLAAPAERPFPRGVPGPLLHGGDHLANPIEGKRCRQEPGESAQEQLGLCQQQNAGQDRQRAAGVRRAQPGFVVGPERLQHLQDAARDQEQSDQE